jgi:hypothetical protein
MAVWIVPANAKAGPGCAMPAHQAHALLVFVAAPAAEGATARALDAREDRGWYDGGAQQAGGIDVEALNGMDPVFREAYELAAAGGAGIICYEDPLED